MTKKESVSNGVTVYTSYSAQNYDKSPDAIVILNKNNEVLHVNDSFESLFKYSFEEIKKKNINQFIVPYELLDEEKELSKIAIDRHIVRKDTKRKSKDGKIIWVSALGLPVMIEKEEGVLVIYNDISRTIEAKEKSDEANRMKTALIANMSHEFRTPMSAILGFSDILKEELTNDEHLSMIRDIHSSARRLLNTLNSILELAHLESANFKPNFSSVNLSVELASLSKVLKNLAGNKSLSFSLDIDDNNCISYIDTDIFNQIISNVFDNAIKYTHKGGIGIRICTKNEDGKNWVFISISDTGIGISKENQKVIFNEFRQVSEGISRNYEGTGLGLTLSKKMTELMGGKIHVDSEIGKGSVFTIQFPLARDTIVLEQNKTYNFSGLPHSELPDSKPRILLVEDNKTNKVLMKRFLQNHFQIDDVSSGKEAIEAMPKENYVLILMDINLGIGMNGLETAREIRKMPVYKNTPIIAVTGYALAGEKETILASGFSDYISKPFTREQLLDVLICALEKSS
ncbi:MAG: ATP-binding protein [Ignavibacteria bacterium]|nr:ATP-binding protein [Ignavibacteria bacterium]